MQIKYINIANGESSNGANVYIDEIEHCPVCKHATRPTKLYGKIFKDNVGNAKLSMTYYCNHCYKTFISQHSNEKYDSKTGCYYFYNLDYVAPSQFEETIFEDCINNISPMFVKIYNQASAAEHYTLDEIAGIGYRKALEFLIKDYCIFKNSDKSDEIAKAHLADCINDYITDERIKSLAKVSAWLGNDETHYIKKFEDKDIQDLKKFINTTVYFILYNLNVDEANDIINAQTK